MRRALLLLALLIGCAAPEVDELAGGEQALDEPTRDAGVPLVAPARCLLLAFDPACVGQWASPSDRFSRWRAHPVTGRGTFPCAIVDGQCEQPWYRDPRCVEGQARLEATCAAAGGVCAPHEGLAYCVAPPT